MGDDVAILQICLRRNVAHKLQYSEDVCEITISCQHVPAMVTTSTELRNCCNRGFVF